MSQHILASSFAEAELKSLHFHPKSPLRAWNAADELALKHLAQLSLNAHTRVLVVNDSQGALAVSLSQFQVHSWGDNATSFLALKNNLIRNQIAENAVTCIPSTSELNGHYDVVVIQLPKTLSLLEYQLIQLRPHISAQTTLIGAGMVKHMANTMVELFAKLIGPTKTSLAEKKARLVLPEFDPSIEATAPSALEYGIPNSPLMLTNTANVFSRQKLDIGTRFLLENFPDLSSYQTILDLGCGNGALGCYGAWKFPGKDWVFVDDSYLAVQSARQSFEKNALEGESLFYCADALEGDEVASNSLDAVLCNPPFHEGNKVHTDIAQRMFKGAARCLKPGGVLTIVANRHLPYRPMLKTHFRAITMMAQNSKFVIIQASK